MSELSLQILLMVVEATLAAVVLLVLFHSRRVVGIAPFCTAVGVFYYLATLLAGTTFIQVAPGLMMSPGSVALFPASLFAVLLVYIREDAGEARNMVYGLLAANIAASLLGLLVVQHLRSPLVVNTLALPPELFVQSPRLFIVGLLALFTDSILVIMVYEAVSRVVRLLAFRVWISLALVLVFDTVMFVTGAFGEHPAYSEILLSGIFGKLAASVVYAAALTLYLLRAGTGTESRPGLADLFQVLTYRQKYEALRAQAVRDTLTGVHNRGFFDEVLRTHLAAALRSGSPISVMLVDVDRLKRINDTYGHGAGDRALQVIAQALAGAARASDVVCRHGGEEFCLILPATSLESAAQLAARIREDVTTACAAEDVGGGVRVTVTIGVAACPADGTEVDELMRVAAERLYRGKDEGRDRVVATPAALSPQAR